MSSPHHGAVGSGALDTPISGQLRSRQRRTPPKAQESRMAPHLVIVGLLILAAAVALGISHFAVRQFEAVVAAWWLGAILPPQVFPTEDMILVTSMPNGPLAFQITAECTSVVLIAPLLVFGAFLALRARGTIVRVLVATLSGVLVAFLVNQVRIGIILGATHLWNVDPGYEIAHVFVGSAIGVLGFMAALVLMLAIVGKKKKSPRPTSTKAESR